MFALLQVAADLCTHAIFIVVWTSDTAKNSDQSCRLIAVDQNG